MTASDDEAQQLAAWVRHMLGAGHGVEDIQKMLRGESVDEVDLSIIEGSIGALKKALATGDHDALLAAEKAGPNRKGAMAAIESRSEEHGAG